MNRFFYSLGLGAALLSGCGQISNPVAGTQGGTTAPAAAFFPSPDAPVGTPSSLQWGIVDTITAAVQDANFWYVIGSFTASGQVISKYLMPLSLTTGQFAPTPCHLDQFNGGIGALVVTSTDIYAAGSFTSYSGQSANYIAKIHRADCTLDTIFSPPANNGFNNSVAKMVLAGGSLYIGGYFNGYRGVTNSANFLAKLDAATGVQDASFSPPGATANGFNSNVTALAASASSLYVGGYFSAYQGVAFSANKLAKLDLTTGVLDTTFSPPGSGNNGFDDWPPNVLLVNGTSLYAGGTFTSYRSTSNAANAIAKLDLNTGSLDTTFSPPGAGNNGFGFGAVESLAASGTSLYVGGGFNVYRGVSSAANGLAKLDLNSGALDTTFDPAYPAANGFSAQVLGLGVSGSSLYVITGSPSFYRGVAVPNRYLGKVDLTSGVLDTSWVLNNGGDLSGLNSAASGIAINGSDFFLYGYFTGGAGYSTNYIAKISKATGVPDTTFSPPANNGFNSAPSFLSLAGQALVVEGNGYSTYQGNAVQRFVYIDKDTGVQLQ